MTEKKEKDDNWEDGEGWGEEGSKGKKRKDEIARWEEG